MKLISLDTFGMCPLCTQNPPDVNFMQPAMCRYCVLWGGGWGIGSRSGSKENLLREMNTIVIGSSLDQKPTTYHTFKPDGYIKVVEIGFLPAYSKMLLPKGCRKKTKFYTRRLACNTYDLPLYPIIKESEEGLTIQLYEDNIIEDWKSYFDYKKQLPRSCHVAVRI